MLEFPLICLGCSLGQSPEDDNPYELLGMPRVQLHTFLNMLVKGFFGHIFNKLAILKTLPIYDLVSSEPTLLFYLLNKEPFKHLMLSSIYVNQLTCGFE